MRTYEIRNEENWEYSSLIFFYVQTLLKPSKENFVVEGTNTNANKISKHIINVLFHANYSSKCFIWIVH